MKVFGKFLEAKKEQHKKNLHPRTQTWNGRNNQSGGLFQRVEMLRHASVKKATDLNRYRFNLIRYTDAKPNLHKPNAITEGRLTVLKTDVKAQG